MHGVFMQTTDIPVFPVLEIGVPHILRMVTIANRAEEMGQDTC
jgi:hypothetical protein